MGVIRWSYTSKYTYWMYVHMEHIFIDALLFGRAAEYIRVVSRRAPVQVGRWRVCHICTLIGVRATVGGTSLHRGYLPLSHFHTALCSGVHGTNKHVVGVF